MKSKPITVVSLFSGCGGMDLGLIGGFDFLGKHYAKTGFDIIWANEINPAACKTYRENFGDYIVEGDIGEQIKNLPSTADIVVGGFPCQDISINGKMLGVNGKRSSLYTYIVEAVNKIKPKVFIAENVGGLLLKQNEYSLNKILEDFNSLGYNLSYQLYHAEDYGVPQTRERVIFVGTKKDYLTLFLQSQVSLPLSQLMKPCMIWKNIRRINLFLIYGVMLKLAESKAIAD